MLWMGLISAFYAVVVYGFLVYGLHTGVLSVTLAAVVITAVFNLNNIFFGLAWDMSFLGETASHARRAFYMIDLPHETTQESKVFGRNSHRNNLVEVDDTEKPLAAEKPLTGENLLASPESLNGDIRFEHYTMSYREDSKLILNDLSLTIPQGRKVGIVGRTGAGKSSLMQALFRMVYHHSGDIFIGDQSVFCVDINYLRSRFGVVPQDPYLFMGTIRFNLTGELTGLSDDQLRMAL
ncbi:MAG TPA: ABC transporter ATP-binding protein, partial [Gammaproteobacteria bacterium]|nr:ABC transporter ATP-binding protein [Gammaproteobacteria bacterium]